MKTFYHKTIYEILSITYFYMNIFSKTSGHYFRAKIYELAGQYLTGHTFTLQIILSQKHMQ